MHVYVYNNTENPLTIPFQVNDYTHHLRFERQVYNQIDLGPLELITGGFTDDGKAKGGIAASYFNKLTSIRIGDDVVRKPQLELGTPRSSDEIHVCPEIKGARKHHRSLKTEARAKREDAMLALLAQQTELIKQLQGGARKGQVEVEMDLGNGVKAKAWMTAADAQAYAASLGNVDSVSAPYDPANKTIAEIDESLDALSAAEIRALIGAEQSGKNRKGALEAMADALEIVEA